MAEIYGNIHSTESFGSADGPGVRFIVFLQGCRMRCRYCHNPDTWALAGGQRMSAQQVLQKALRYKSYWRKNGGITVSGGEAMLQMEFVTELFRLAKAQGVHTCLDTSGSPFTRAQPFYGQFEQLMQVTDLFMLDIKEIDDEAHRSLTGHSNQNILDMARCLAQNGKPMWIRHVLVPTLTANEQKLRRLRAFLDTLPTVQRVEVLPYHTLGVFKWQQLGIPYTLEGIQPPTAQQIEQAKAILGAN